MKQPIDAMSSVLTQAERPVMLVTPECELAPDFLVETAECLALPVFTTPDRPNAFRADHPLAGYHATFAWCDFTASAAEQCDAVFIVGRAPSRFALDGFLGGDKAFVQACALADDVCRRPVPSCAVVGAIETTLAELRRAYPTRRRPHWFARLKRERDRRIIPEDFPVRAGVIHPDAAGCAIAEELPPGACVSVDVGEHAAFFLKNARLSTEHRTLIAIERSACMGHTFCASIGWCLGRARPTLALVGDGGFRMHSQEVHTAVELALQGWVAVVWENGGFGMVSHALDMQFGPGHGISAGAWRFAPDLAQLARAWGASASDANDVEGLRAGIRAGFRSNRPHVVVAHIDSTVEPPIRGRLKQLPEAATGSA